MATLAMLPVLDRTARVLRAVFRFEGPCRYEFVVDSDDHVIGVWPHQEPGKLTRAELDKLTIPDGVDLSA